MTTEEITTTHEYIIDNDLLNAVESITKKNWRGSGSRTTYYSAVKKASLGIPLNEFTLVEGLMIMEAGKLANEHRAKNEMSAQAATA